MKTKIYEIQINGEREWVCADTVIEALRMYSSITDITLADFDNDDDIVEVQREKWSEMNIVDTDGEYNNETGYPVIMTFAEYMKKAAILANIIATTNF